MLDLFFEIEVSYGQLAIFPSAERQPFNDWTQQHVDQGFAWRPRCASFRTLCEAGKHAIHLELADHLSPPAASAIRVIDVPFEVPSDGTIEVASIGDGQRLALSPGMYALRCEFRGPDDLHRQHVELKFARFDNPHFAVVVADRELLVGPELLTTAEPAQ